MIEFSQLRTLRRSGMHKVPGKPAVVTAKLEEDNINVVLDEPVHPNGIITKHYVSGKYVNL